MNRFAKMKKERIYTLLGTLSWFILFARSKSNIICILSTNIGKNKSSSLFGLQIGAWQKRTLYNILCFRGLCSKVVIPTGLEPISKEPESFILSIELGDHIIQVQS